MITLRMIEEGRSPLRLKRMRGHVGAPHHDA